MHQAGPLVILKKCQNYKTGETFVVHVTERGTSITEPLPPEKGPIFQKKFNEGEITEWGSSTSVKKHNRHIRNLLKFCGLQYLMKNTDHMNGSTNVSKSKSHLKIPGARRVTSVYGRPGAPDLCARHMNSSILQQKKLKPQIFPLKHSDLSRKKNHILATEEAKKKVSILVCCNASDNNVLKPAVIRQSRKPLTLYPSDIYPQ